MDEVGPAAHIAPSKILEALALVRQGRVYDLDTGRWPGMKLPESAAPFQVVSYRTPAGLRVDQQFPSMVNTPAQYAWIDELVIGSVHSGTHMDALSHVTIGTDDHWYAGSNAANHLGDFGVTRCDGASIPPIVTRGVLIDVAHYLGLDVLPAGHRITEAELGGSLSRQGVKLESGDAVLIRTGYMQVWQTANDRDFYGSGLGLEAGCWLADQGVVAIGVDNDNVEAIPSEDALVATPLHIELLTRRGIYLVETMYLEALARDFVYQFLFLCFPPRIQGTTGAHVRPIAMA
jgi:kynurenine formamidase